MKAVSVSLYTMVFNMTRKNISQYQLELFPETNETKMSRQIEELKIQCEKLRKGHYARGNEQKKEIDEIKHKLETLIVAVCRNQEYGKSFIR